jgi:CheY-like chemotaxis protein
MLGTKNASLICWLEVSGGEEVAQNRTDERQRSVAGPRVLIVDDYPDLAESLAMILRLVGYDVDIALSGKEALRKAEAHAPEVVVLDLAMPLMDGFEVARRLKRAFADKVKLVAVSAQSSPEDFRRCLEAGFDRHFVKPADPKRLERTLRELASEKTGPSSRK